MKESGSIRIAMVLLVLVGTVIAVRPVLPQDDAERLTRAAAVAFSREEWRDARVLAEQALAIHSENPDALAIAGIASTKLHDNQLSVEHLERFEQVQQQSRPHTQTAALVALGNRYRQQGRLIEAEQLFYRALAINPEYLPAHTQLHHILSFEGRCAEAAPHLLAQVQSGIFSADELYLLGIPDRISIFDDRLREQSERNEPDDPLRQLGKARLLVNARKLDEAEPLVKDILGQHPQLGLAHSLLGQILLQQNRLSEFIDWHGDVPPAAAETAEMWFVRSLWARQTGQPDAAVRCLLETLASDPSHVKANYQLSQLFHKLGDEPRARHFSERSLALSTLGYVINDLRGNPDLPLMQQAATALEKLGRGWEAIAWCRMARQSAEQQGADDWTQPYVDRLRAAVSRETDLILAGYHPLEGIRIEDYPLPEFDLETPPDSPAQVQNSMAVRFADMAAESGLDFHYFNSMNNEVGLEHIFQTTGGGVASLDFDLDLWPDLYFGNGKVLPESIDQMNDGQEEHRDELFRNLGGRRFLPVTQQAGLGDDRFTQGVAAGDFNNDGFPDLYVGNVGSNRLYQNNGDGTFTEVAGQAGTAGNEWTMSAMIADIDGDGLGDIYAVNYLNMQQVFDRSCKKDGQPLTCAPTLFAAEQDRLYRNRGDGTFEDVTDTIGIAHPNGKGLGIVGFSIEGRPGLQLFIANDTTENLFFESKSRQADYTENAVLAGVAMSEAGTMQACMGVAAGDVDADGSVDLFVTNFYADSNTMYLQTVPGVFTDATRDCSLTDPSFGMVGFGTQCLDADLDGDLDLLVTNGHVDQTFATGEPDRMPPQFFQNDGRGRFTELAPEVLGPFFERELFGRALTRLDWNRDGDLPNQDMSEVPMKYRNPETTPEVFEVKEGSNEYQLDMKP